MEENKIKDTVKALFNYVNDDTSETLDLTTKEGLYKFNELIDKCLKDNSLESILMKTLFGVTSKDLNDVKELAKGLFESANKKEVKVPARPSESIDDTNVKMQIHKLVDEYTKEYIFPFYDKNVSNDIYAGLFEFACWIFNHHENNK